ncbi:MAG: hypothetical protein RJA35_212 [Actinomycetota bacterium]|jgi:proteasome accessory factor B
MSDRISPSERQLNLTFALLRSPRGLTLREVVSTVPGYGYLKTPTEASKAQFTRDKNDIRKAGIVLEQVTEPGFETDNQLYRYRVASRTFAWPENFHPTALQTRLLELAAQCWQDISLTDELQMAMTRLVALGDVPDRQAIAELVPSFRPLDAAFGPIAAAIEDQLSITFNYRKAGSTTVESRFISPWRFLNIEGEWLIQGWDHDREDTRNFLLKRIVDKNVKVSKSDDPYVEATDELLRLADADLEKFRAENIAVIEVTPNTAAWSHFEMDFEESTTKTLRYMDKELLAIQLRRFGSQLRVVEPQQLADEIAAGLKKVAAAHA